MCIRFGCDPFTDDGCAADQLCVDAEWGPICLPRCGAAADCRAGYQCVSSPEPDVRVCLPRCTDHAQCTDGRRCDFLTSRCIDPEG
jgi:hypothetical protein